MNTIGDTTAADCFNRPMAEADLVWLAQTEIVAEMRSLLERYVREGLPVMNGSLRYSNFTEGPEHSITLHPYRQWEYASLIRRLPELAASVRFLCVGGAGSLLPYVLAERGHPGVAVEMNPFLVAACNHVAEQRKLPLQAVGCDARTGLGKAGTGFDLVTMISVLEHIPEPDWPAVFQNAAKALRKGGWFYLTFDYGGYETAKPFGRSIRDIQQVLRALPGTGLVPVGNDPAQLSRDWLERRSAPDHERIGRLQLLNTGPADGATPWTFFGKQLVKRVAIHFMRPQTRYAQHNFFRLLLEKR